MIYLVYIYKVLYMYDRGTDFLSSSGLSSSGLRSDKLHNCAESTSVYRLRSSVLRSSLQNAHKQVSNYMSINILHNINS